MQSQAQFIDLYRAGLSSATELIKASLQQTERLQQQQLEMVRGAIEDTERSTQQIPDAKSIDDIIALNSRTTGIQLERVTEFWSSVWGAAGASQKLMVDQLQLQLGQAADRVRKCYDFTARTSEEAARLSATRMADSAKQLRGAIVEQDRQDVQPQTQGSKAETRKSA